MKKKQKFKIRNPTGFFFFFLKHSQGEKQSQKNKQKKKGLLNELNVGTFSH